MSRIINGTLFVPSYVPTGNPGEWTITNATYTNVTDATGNGAFDLKEGFLLYPPASDKNTYFVIPGVVYRYRITQIQIVDADTINATILWDGGGAEIDAPTNGALATICEPGDGPLKLGLPVSEDIYPNLTAGSDIATIAADRKSRFAKLDQWTKVSLSYSDFNLGNKVVSLINVPKLTMVEKIVCKHKQPFLGAGTCKLSVGIPTAPASFMSSFDVSVPPQDSYKNISITEEVPSFENTVTLKVTANTNTQDSLTQGDVDFWIKTSSIE